MSDHCYSFPILKRVLAQAERMDTMMEALGVDPRVSIRQDAGAAWYEARSRCIECSAERSCRRWLDEAGSPGAPAPPEFCPNGAFFRACLAGSLPQP